MFKRFTNWLALVDKHKQTLANPSGDFLKAPCVVQYTSTMIQLDKALNGSPGNDGTKLIVTHSMRQMSTLPRIDAVAPIKIVPSSPSASNSNDWRMVLQQGIRERCQVLRKAH